MTEIDDSTALRLWRRRLSERAFVATNLPLAGVIAAFAIDSLIAQQGCYVGIAVLLAMLAFPWQILVFVLRGVLWVQSSAIAGASASPSQRARIAAAGARGWIIGGAVAGLAVAVTVPLSRLARLDGAEAIAACGFLLLGPVAGLALSTGMMNVAADRLAAAGDAVEANGKAPAA